MKQSDIEKIGLFCSVRMAFFAAMHQDEDIDSAAREVAGWAERDLKGIYDKILAAAGPRVSQKLTAAPAFAESFIKAEVQRLQTE